MAIVGTDSIFAIGKQSAKGAAAANPVYVDAIAPDFNIANNTRIRRAHIGQSPFARSAYKVGVGVPISATFEATPGIIAKALELALGKAQSGAWYSMVLDSAGNTLTVTDGTNTAAINLAATDLASEIKTQLEASAIVNTASNEYVIVNKYNSDRYNIGLINIAPADIALSVDVASAHTGNVTLSEVSGGAHHISLDLADKYSVPWFTAWRGVGKNGSNYHIQERALDGKVASLTLGFTGSDAVLTQLTGAALRPDKVDGSTITLPAESYDTLPIMTVMDGAHATIKVDGTEYGTRSADTATSSPLQILSAGFEMGNALTPIEERYAIGSKYPVGLDVTARAVGLTMVCEIDDGELYNQLVYEGTSWQDKVLEGTVRIASTTAVDISAGDIPHVVEMLANKVYFTPLMVPVRPRQLVRAQLTATVLSLDSNSQSEFEFYVFNEDETL